MADIGGTGESRSAQAWRSYARNRLIESHDAEHDLDGGTRRQSGRRGADHQELFFPGGIAFIAGSVMDTFSTQGRYSRMSGKGTLQFGAFLDSTLDRIEEGIVRLRSPGISPSTPTMPWPRAACVFVVLGSLMVFHGARAGGGAGRRMQGRARRRDQCAS